MLFLTLTDTYIWMIRLSYSIIFQITQNRLILIETEHFVAWLLLSELSSSSKWDCLNMWELQSKSNIFHLFHAKSSFFNKKNINMMRYYIKSTEACSILKYFLRDGFHFIYDQLLHPQRWLCQIQFHQI